MVTNIDWLIESCQIAASVAVNALARGGYEDVAVSAARGHFTAEQLRHTVTAYPDRLIRPPDVAFWEMRVVLEPGTDPMVLHSAMRLWTENEGRSRLVARFRFTQWVEVDPLVVKCELVSLSVEDPQASVQTWPPAS